MRPTATSRACRAGLMLGLLAAMKLLHAQEAIRLAEDQQVSAQGDVEFSFDLSEIPADEQVRLCLAARIEWGGLGGSTVAMVIHVNGEGVVGRHLINKPLVYSMRNDDELQWGAEAGSWYRLIYSPDFSDRVSTDEDYEYGVPDTDPYRFVWDITSLVRAGTNSVKVGTVQGMALSLRLRDVTVETGAPLPPLPEVERPGQPTAPADPNGRLPVYVPKGPAQEPTSISVSSCGDIRFDAGGREFRVRSRTSLPQGQWSDGGRASATWRRLARDRSVTAKWVEADYSVRRQVTLHPDRIAVADTIRNTSEALLGVIHEVRLQLPGQPDGAYLCGRPVKRMRQRSSPSHPTAMAQFGNLVVGLVAEDDIFRVHSKAFVEDKAVALSDPQLAIRPGKARTLEWSVYADPKGDYWDFVNAIRRNWGSNVTLRGPSRWVHPGGVPTAAESARPWLGRIGMVVLCNPMFGTEEERAQGITIQHGTALLLCDGWCELAGNVVSALKEADPAVETFIYTHQNLCTEPGHEGKYRDSLALDTAGAAVRTVYTPSPSLFLPTLDNSYGRALTEVSQLIAEGLDANVYIDEITASNVPAFGAYGDTWDGCTVVIDPVSHAVTGKVSSAILLMQPWRAAQMEYLKSRGKTVIANGPHYTRTMSGWGLQCFVESAPEDNAVVGAHLSHPLCLTDYSNPDPRTQCDIARRLLDRAGISFACFSIEAPMFPITPIELRAGVVIGEERILTNRSGRFGWGDDSSADVYVLDGQGERVAAPDVTEVRKGNAVFTELRMPANHLAVLVRQPHER